jgi:hypothetical protein
VSFQKFILQSREQRQCVRFENFDPFRTDSVQGGTVKRSSSGPLSGIRLIFSEITPNNDHLNSIPGCPRFSAFLAEISVDKMINLLLFLSTIDSISIGESADCQHSRITRQKSRRKHLSYASFVKQQFLF